MIELPCCYIPLSQYLIATAPNGKRHILRYDRSWGEYGAWIGYVLYVSDSGHPLGRVSRVEFGPNCVGDLQVSTWTLRIYCRDAFQNRPTDFQATVDCTTGEFSAVFDVPSLHPDCWDTDEMHGTWTITDPGQLCTSCCCARSMLVVNPGGQCCASLADPDGTVPLTAILWDDFLLLGTCHLESASFYVIGPNRDCEVCDICNTCDSFLEVVGLMSWVVEQLAGTNPGTCLVRASLVGVADCPRTWVVYELDNITQQQCAGTATLTLAKVSESVSDTFDCTFPDEISFQNA
jgi:hypothetical protein